MYNSKTSMKDSQGKEHCLICPPPSNSPTSPSLPASLCISLSSLPPPPPSFTTAGFLIIDHSLAQTTERSKIRVRCQGADLEKIRLHGGPAQASKTILKHISLLFNIILFFVRPLLTPLSLLSPSPSHSPLCPLSLVSSCHGAC